MTRRGVTSSLRMRRAPRPGFRIWLSLAAAITMVLVTAPRASAQSQQQSSSDQSTGQSSGQTTTPPQSSTAPQTGTPAAAPEETAPKTWGNYNISQSIEFGYRDSMIGGNLNNYDTFENLQSGMRLFDYTVDMHSIDHHGVFFDNLTFANFGYGGDPNDVSRLHVDKNKWYDLRVMFRRDKNFWNYDLLANPLNPTTFTPAVAITSSPQALDLSRHMQDYDLTLLPQSRVRFRLGYSRNSDQGPAAGTVEGGTEPDLSQMLLYRTSSYRMGMDYTGLSKTTLSFDELLTYSKIDENETDNNLTYQLSNGTPVDLGLVFTGTTPCASSAINQTTTPPTASSTCNAYLSYSQVQNPRAFFPTERARFQSTFVKNLSMTGSVGYSGGNNTIPDFNEFLDGWTSRSLTRESTTGGPASAKQISVNADWAGDYRITDKLYLVDQFEFMNWRSPSMWDTAETNVFDAPSSLTGMLAPISVFTPTNFATLCPTAPYNQTGCPQHNTSSGADITSELVQQFLGQDVKANTIELKYDFSKRVSAHIGYMYRDRDISDFSATWDTGEIYFPGGAGGTAANDYFAARGDCAMVSGQLPTGCVLNANGSVQEGTPTNLVPEAGNDTARNFYLIHESAGIAGVAARITDNLRINADIMAGYNDNSFTRISPRQLQSYKIHVLYNPAAWAHIDGAVDIHENRDNVSMVSNLEHGRTYSFVTTLSPNSKLWVDFGFHYMDIYTQTEICFVDTGSTVFTTANSPCPVPAAVTAGVPLGTLSFYSSHDYYAYGDVMWKPYKRVTAVMGYAGSIVRGNTTFLNPLTPTGTLDFDYLKPFVNLTVDIYKGVSYKTSWNYYGYNDKGVANPVGLAALPAQDFNGSNVTFAVKYVF